MTTDSMQINRKTNNSTSTGAQHYFFKTQNVATISPMLEND